MNDYNIIHIRETNSTNLYLKELSETEKLPQGFTVYTDFQTAGRGQQGNIWESEPGMNLLFSTIIYPHKLEAGQQFILSQIISLAIKETLDNETSDISIKWPNDIYWHEKKIAGILIENEIMGDYISQSIIGVGINLNQETFTSNAPNPVSLKQITGKTLEIRPFLEKILIRLKYYTDSLPNKEASNTIRRRYKESLFRRDGFHSFTDNGHETFEAEILDIKDSGILILRKESGEIQQYAFRQIRFEL